MKLIKRKTRWLNALAVTAALAGLNGCERYSEQDHLLRAKNFRNEGKLDSGVIELKTVLQQHPKNIDARFLLGELYLDLGQPAEAEIELLKAKELGMAEEPLQVPLGRALLAQGLYKRVLSEIDADEKFRRPEKARILALRGQAHLALNQVTEGCVLFVQSSQINTEYIPAYLGLARCAAAKGHPEESRAQLTQALKLDGKNSDTWALLGDVERMDNHLAEAATAYTNALKYNPRNLDAQLGRAAASIAADKPDEATPDIDAVLKVAKNHPVANHLKGVVLYRRGNYADAKTSFDQALAASPGYAPAVLWLGYTSYAQGNYAQAETQFAEYLKQDSGAVRVRALRALSQAKMGGRREAQETVALLRNAKIDDVPTLSALGQTHMLLGEKDIATQYFQQVVLKAPERAEPRVELANALLQKGEGELAIAQLQKAATLSPENAQVQEKLIQALIQNKQFDKALVAIKALQARQPQSPLPHHYLGIIALAQNNAELANAEFLKAWTLSPGDPRTGNNLAMLAVSKGNAEEGRNYYRKVLDRNKDDLPTLMGLYNLEVAAKRPDEARKILEEAHAKYPSAVQPATLLAERYLAAGQPQKALEVTEAAAQAVSNDPRLLDARGMAYLARRDPARALEVYQRLAKLLPDSAEANFKLGGTQVLLKDPAARASLVRALKLQPSHSGAKLALAQLNLQEGKNDEALRLARELKKEHPELVEGVLTEAQALANQKKLPEAVRLLEQAQKAQPASEALAFGHANLRWGAGDKDGGLRVIAEWQERHPNDVRAAVQAAQAYLALGSEAQATDAYEKALKIAPAEPTVLNNLAWLSRKTNPKRALELAEKANSLRPNDAGITDTLGSLLVEQGVIERGLELAQKAHQLAPGQPDIHYHYAAALAKAGQKERAHRELERLLESKKRFSQEAEARALLQQL